jgi:hypothetical protein
MMVVVHIAREQIAVSSSVKRLDEGGTVITNDNRPKLRYADVQILGAQVRVTFDGSTNPVGGSTGQLWNPGDIKRVWGVKNMENIRFIREGSSDATVVVDYWGSQ